MAKRLVITGVNRKCDEMPQEPANNEEKKDPEPSVQQNLLKSLDEVRLEDLDREMSAIVNNEKLEGDEKLRLYEEKLAEFRQLQSKIIKQGGTSLVTNNDTAQSSSSLEDVKGLLESIFQMMQSDLRNKKKPRRKFKASTKKNGRKDPSDKKSCLKEKGEKKKYSLKRPIGAITDWVQG